MPTMMSACGVLCSDCPAYLADAKGPAHRERVSAAWKRIYGLNEPAAKIACGGCLAPDSQVFHTSRTCGARRCCRAKGFSSCAECAVDACPALEKAQSLWDGVPELTAGLTPDDFAAYAQPYCGHRRRLAESRHGSVRQPLADARGSDPSRDREGAVAARTEETARRRD